MYLPPKLEEDFDAQVIAALMVRCNAFLSKRVVRHLCCLSFDDIDRRIKNGTFPQSHQLSSHIKTTKKYFYLHDIQEWLKNPKGYRQRNL